MKPNFAEDIENAAGGEAIQAIVIGDDMWDWERDENEGPSDMEPLIPKDLRRTVQSWAGIREWLDRKYDDSFGGASCWPIYAWTETRVIYVHEYDGSTSVHWLPRHPTDCKPTMS